MSTQSGITASNELLDAFSQLKENGLLIKVSKESTKLVQDESCPTVSGSLDDKFSQINSYLANIYPQPVYIILPIEENEYTFISFIPDSAHIRDKMLYASTRNTLLQELGSTKIKKDCIFAWTELDEVTFDHYKKCIASDGDSLNAVTEDEELLKKVNALEDVSLNENRNNNFTYSHKLASMDTHSSSSSGQLLFNIDSKLSSEFEQLCDDGKLIIFNIDLSGETFRLIKSFDSIKIDDLTTTIVKSYSDSSPLYAVYNYLPKKYCFIYSCPSGSKVKDRMVYASNKQGLVNHLKSLFQNQEVSLDKVLEVGDIEELELNELKPEEPSATSSKQGGLKFNKPVGPRRRK